MTRIELKRLIKECILEIMTESFATHHTINDHRLPNVLDSAIDVRSTAALSAPVIKKKAFGRLDKSALKHQAASATSARRDAARDAVVVRHSRNMLSDIFDDTARTTLVEQASNDNPSDQHMPRNVGAELSLYDGKSDVIDGADEADIAASMIDPKSLQSDSNRWEKLAFIK